MWCRDADGHVIIEVPRLSHAKRSKKDPKIVKIGIGSTYDFLFEMAQPNLSRFRSDPSPITAINAVWPLWHLCDWYYSQRHPSEDKELDAFRNDLINECSELRLFSPDFSQRIGAAGV